jgi:hypothetical protein
MKTEKTWRVPVVNPFTNPNPVYSHIQQQQQQQSQYSISDTNDSKNLFYRHAIFQE